jgi:hypothetical protein
MPSPNTAAAKALASETCVMVKAVDDAAESISSRPLRCIRDMVMCFFFEKNDEGEDQEKATRGIGKGDYEKGNPMVF